MANTHTHIYIHTKLAVHRFMLRYSFYFFLPLSQFIFSIDFDVLVFKLLSALYFHTLDF